VAIKINLKYRHTYFSNYLLYGTYYIYLQKKPKFKKLAFF